MITDNQARKLMKYLQEEGKLGIAAAKSGMDEKTARKYRHLDQLPSELKAEQIRSWRTREDPFEEVWGMVKSFLENNSGLEAKTLFEHLQRRYSGRYSDGQIRTFQRKVKHWRATEGPAREVFFPQVHKPGELSQSDFTPMYSFSPVFSHNSHRGKNHNVYFSRLLEENVPRILYHSQIENVEKLWYLPLRYFSKLLPILSYHLIIRNICQMHYVQCYRISAVLYSKLVRKDIYVSLVDFVDLLLCITIVVISIASLAIRGIFMANFYVANSEGFIYFQKIIFKIFKSTQVVYII